MQSAYPNFLWECPPLEKEQCCSIQSCFSTAGNCVGIQNFIDLNSCHHHLFRSRFFGFHSIFVSCSCLWTNLFRLSRFRSCYSRSFDFLASMSLVMKHFIAFYFIACMIKSFACCGFEFEICFCQFVFWSLL